MIGELLLFFMVTDLRELSDNDLRDSLELLVGCPSDPLLEVQEKVIGLLQEEVLNREEIEALPDDYSDFLPLRMSGYEKALDEFEVLLEELFEDDSLEENDKVGRFRQCLEMLDDESDWQARAEAARGLATLEEELCLARDRYLQQPIQLSQCSSFSVIAHRNLMDGFEIWQDAFRLAHKGEPDEALEAAVEATYIFCAVERWATSPVPA